jgi:hypothetical protein
MVDALNPDYSSLDGALFDKNQTTLLAYPGGRPGSYTIPGTVTNIENNAFLGCAGLTKVAVPDNLTRMGDGALGDCINLSNVVLGNSLTNLGNGVFLGCISLTAIDVGPLNPSYSSVEGVLFDKNQTTLIQFPLGRAGAYTTPSEVTSIAPNAFYSCTNLTSIGLGNDITNIGFYAFAFSTSLADVTIGPNVTRITGDPFFMCSSLKAIYFRGNAPSVDISPFPTDDHTTIYYLPGTTGWTSTLGGRPAVLWNPLAQTNDSSFGVRQNRFGFNITGTPDIPLVVEASTNLAAPSWVPLQSFTLTNGSVHFSDPQWTNFPDRFYRIRSP